MDLSGLFTAVVTPFTQDGKLDEKGLRDNIEFQIREGVDGIVALGTTGEDPTLTPAEQERVIAIARETTANQLPLVIGTGSYSTAITIEKTKKAKQAGADAALIVCPYYNRPTQEGLYQHFKAIAQAVDLPIIVYNHQGRTGQNLLTPTLKRIAEFQQVIGVKETSGNINQIMEVVQVLTAYRPNFKIVSGDDALAYPLMACGGHGVISVASNLIPSQMVEMVNAAWEQNYSYAREQHYKLLPFFNGESIETNPIPIKAAMNWWGMPAGQCRLPLYQLSPENAKIWKQIVDQYQPAESRK
jgi:4-hydroxy-tetrahydrodipicolinate synthase